MAKKPLELEKVFTQIARTMPVSEWRYDDYSLDMDEVVASDGGLALLVDRAKRVSDFLNLGKFFEPFEVVKNANGLFELVLHEKPFHRSTAIYPVLTLLEEVVDVTCQMNEQPDIFQFLILDELPENRLQNRLVSTTLGEPAQPARMGELRAV